MTEHPFDTRREAVAAFLQEHFQFQEPEQAMKNMPALAIRMAELGFDVVVPALQVLLRDTDSHTKVYAAWWMMVIHQNAPVHVRADQQAGASAVFVDAMRERDIGIRLWPMVLLTCGNESVRALPVPVDARPLLKKMLKDPDDRLRITAAAIYLRCATSRGTLDAILVLEQGLKCENPTLAMMAAGALGQVRFRSKEVVHKLVQMLSQVEPQFRHCVVLALRSIGSPARSAIEPLLNIFRDEKADHNLLCVCAGALAAICGTPASGEAKRYVRQRSEIIASLKEATHSGIGSLVWSAFLALKEIGEIPLETVDLLIEKLHHDDETERAQAAIILSSAGPGLKLAIPDLISQLGAEPSKEVCWAIVRALVAGRVDALPALIEELRADNPRTMVFVAEAMVQIGTEAAAEFAVTLLNHDDQRVREFGAALLARMGKKAVAAVPVVIELIRHPNPAIRETAVASIAFMGPGAREAIPDLVAALSDPHLDIAHWAQKALAVIGPEIVPSLRSALPTCTVSGQERVSLLLSHFTGSEDGDTPDGFEWFGDDDDLVLFAWVGHSLKNPISLRKLADRLEKLAESGEWRHAYATAESSLRVKLDSISSRLNRGMKTQISLIERVDSKTSRLTVEAAELLARITTYLKKIGRFVAPGSEWSASPPG